MFWHPLFQPGFDLCHDFEGVCFGILMSVSYKINVEENALGEH